MQHIINIAFDFDDKRITEITEAQYEEKVGKIIEKAVLDRIAPPSPWRRSERDWDKLDEIIRNGIREQIESHKDEIIEKSIKRIAESVPKTKAFKEKFNGL